MTLTVVRPVELARPGALHSRRDRHRGWWLGVALAQAPACPGLGGEVGPVAFTLPVPHPETDPLPLGRPSAAAPSKEAVQQDARNQGDRCEDEPERHLAEARWREVLAAHRAVAVVDQGDEGAHRRSLGGHRASVNGTGTATVPGATIDG